MKKSILIIMLSTISLFGQIPGFTDDFEDGSLDTLWNDSLMTLWHSDWYPDIFNLTESEGVLEVAYDRKSTDSDWPAFYFTPPEVINVAHNPKIVIEIKSDITINFAIKPVYTNGKDNYQSTTVPGSNTWQTYTFTLSNYAGGYCNQVVFHFDGGTKVDKQGTVCFDNFIIAGFSISIQGLNAKFDPINQYVDLVWSCDNEAAVDHYNVYRDTLKGFSCTTGNLIGEPEGKNWRDTQIGIGTYYYKVAAVDTMGKQHAVSMEMACRTYTIGAIPVVEIADVNSNTVGKYDKFEINLRLTEASYGNPYDSDEIDVFAYFISPLNDAIRINGFFDNYLDVAEWKIRFAPPVIGQWEYQVFASDIDGVGESAKCNFTVVESDYHGCLNVSSVNPHYLIYHDGTPFYGIGAYYPWGVRNDDDGLGILAASGGNLFGYWNGNYDGAGNGGGIYQIESIQSGIGYYDQRKCARIDEILDWAEQRNLEMMLAIWPHDILDQSTWGYKGWDDNAYKTVCNAANFYTDSLAWVYQQKLYRYMLARWGYSRSLGIWELVNEIDGTDGWSRGNKAGALEWVQKVNDYLKENDYFKRPTTISKSGSSANYWPEGYQICDLPNVHLYEKGWSAPYSSDPIRSSYWTYRNVARQLWTGFEKPGIFGEAGAEPINMYAANIEKGSSKYVEIYHNALWSAWASGLAATPIWWEMNDRELMTDEVFAQMKAFARVASDIDYADLNLISSNASADTADAFMMTADSLGFGWFRSYNNNAISGRFTRISGLKTGTYQAIWYDTWAGDSVIVGNCVSAGNMIYTEIPEMPTPCKDIALRLTKTEDGTQPASLKIFIDKPIIASFPVTNYLIICYVSDAENRLCADSFQISLTLEGPGIISNPQVTTGNGVAIFNYLPEQGKSGEVVFTASTEGLASVSLFNNVLSEIEVERNVSIPTEFALKANYPNPFNANTVIEFSLPKTTNIKIDVYNLAGQLVETLVRGRQSAGNYKIFWHPANLPSGIYLYQITCPEFTATRKCMILK